jgi:hypothetical protein
MRLRHDLVKRADRKRAEIAELEMKLREARAYLQSLEDTLKMLPREMPTDAAAPIALRAGSMLARTYTALQKSGRPIHINDLLAILGKPNTRNNKAGLSGTLAAYVRRNEVFTRPAPNTFGLVEWGGTALNGDLDWPEDEPPESPPM